MTEQNDVFLKNTKHIDASHPEIIKLAYSVVKKQDSVKDKAIKLYYKVRDMIRYTPYNIYLTPSQYKASLTLERGEGHCIDKSLLLAALGRACQIPSRVGYANVRNHISTQAFIDALGTDLFVFHGYNEFLIEGKWVKCTPAFNKSLCDKFGVPPLDFDGQNDSIFQSSQPNGQKMMDYVYDYGCFADYPFNLCLREWGKYYAHLLDSNNSRINIRRR